MPFLGVNVGRQKRAAPPLLDGAGVLVTSPAGLGQIWRSLHCTTLGSRARDGSKASTRAGPGGSFRSVELNAEFFPVLGLSFPGRCAVLGLPWEAACHRVVVQCPFKGGRDLTGGRAKGARTIFAVMVIFPPLS